MVTAIYYVKPYQELLHLPGRNKAFHYGHIYFYSLSPEYIKENAELSPPKGLFAYAFAGRDITGKSVEDMVYEAQRKVILELADREPCVIIGRNADYILKDRNDVLNVFITAPDEDRIQRIMETEDVTQTQAEKLMVQIDKMRNNYYSYFTDRKWQHTKDRDIIVNSSLLGIEGTVGMLEYIVNASN